MVLLRSILIIILAAFPIYSAQKVIVTDHTKPFRIRVDEKRIFVAEGPQISIYTKDNFKLISRFGKAGEGPGEFKLLPEFSPEIDINSDKLLATSMSKITIFSKSGKFIREINISHLRQPLLFRKTGNKLIGHLFKFENKQIWNAVNIYDAELKNSKTINTIPFHMKRGAKFNPITRGIYLPNFYISDSSILVGGDLDKNNILIYNLDGKLIRELNPVIDKVKFTKKDKKGWIDSYMINADYKREYERLKERFLYPEYFPLWQNFISDGKNIYIQTFARNENDGTNKYYIYDLKGDLIKSVWLPLTEYFDFAPDPYYIYDSKLYQLSNNYEEETIELKITDINQEN